MKRWKSSGARKHLHETPYPYVLHTNSIMCHTANAPIPDHHLPNHLIIILVPFKDHHYRQNMCLDKLLMHLVSLNGVLQQRPENDNPLPSEPSSPTTTSSTPSSPTTSGSTLTSPSSSTISDSEPESTSGQSTVSMGSKRQLCPHIPIRYNETFLKRLHIQPQVRVMNKVFIPLLTSESEVEEDMDTT